MTASVGLRENLHDPSVKEEIKKDGYQKGAHVTFCITGSRANFNIFDKNFDLNFSFTSPVKVHILALKRFRIDVRSCLPDQILNSYRTYFTRPVFIDHVMVKKEGDDFKSDSSSALVSLSNEEFDEFDELSEEELIKNLIKDDGYLKTSHLVDGAVDFHKAYINRYFVDYPDGFFSSKQQLFINLKFDLLGKGWDPEK